MKTFNKMKNKRNKNSIFEPIESKSDNSYILDSSNQLEEKLTATQIFLAARSLVSNFKNIKSFFFALAEAKDDKEFYDLEKYIKRFTNGIYKVFKCEINFTKDLYLDLKKSLPGTCWADFLEDPEISQSEFFQYNQIIFTEKIKEMNNNVEELAEKEKKKKFIFNFENKKDDNDNENKLGQEKIENNTAPQNLNFSNISAIGKIPDFTDCSINDFNKLNKGKEDFDIDNTNKTIYNNSRESDYENNFYKYNKSNNNDFAIQLKNSNLISESFDNSRILENLREKIFNFFIHFFSFLNTNKNFKEKINPISPKSSLINRMIYAFSSIKKTLEFPCCTEKTKSNAIKILPDIHNRFVKDFLSMFDFNISKSSFDFNALSKTINDLIKDNKSPEKIYELLSCLKPNDNQNFIWENFYKQINLKLYLLNLARNKAKLPVMKKAVKAFPQFAREVIELYLADNENKFAMEIYKEVNLEADSIFKDLKKQIILMSKMKYFIYLYYRYKHKEINFLHVVEHFKDDMEVMKLILKKLFEDNLLLEAYSVLKQFDYGSEQLFSRILVSDFYKLGSNLISWNNTYYKKIGRFAAQQQENNKVVENNFNEMKNKVKIEDDAHNTNSAYNNNNILNRHSNNGSKVSFSNVSYPIQENDIIKMEIDELEVKKDFFPADEHEIKIELDLEETLNINQIKSEKDEKEEDEELQISDKADNNLTCFEFHFEKNYSMEKLFKNSNRAESISTNSLSNYAESFFNPWNFEGKNIYNNISCFKSFIGNLDEYVSREDYDKNNIRNKNCNESEINYNKNFNYNCIYDNANYSNKSAFLITPISDELLFDAAAFEDNLEINSNLDEDSKLNNNKNIKSYKANISKTQNKNNSTTSNIYNNNSKKINNAEEKIEKYQKLKKINFLICNSLRKFIFFFSSNPELNEADPSDLFAPADKSLSFLQIPETSVLFIDSLESFKKVKHAFANSTYIGIDMEWKSKCCLLEADLPSPSIIQLADEKSCFILDYPRLVKNEYFYDFFNEVFTGKVFVSFSFHNDIKHIDEPKIKSFFSLRSQNEIIDLEIEYKRLLNRKTLSLSELSLEVLGNRLCKMEQVSNWNSRPLRKAQMHYAALDAHVLVLLHIKMQD